MADQWHQFIRDDQILFPDSQRMKYFARSAEQKKLPHWEQRKLALAIIQFLNLYWQDNDSAQTNVIYLNPGPNIQFLARLFPTVQWHLYITDRLKLESSDNMTLYEGARGEFTDDVAAEWAKAVKNGQSVLFISNLKSAGRRGKINEQDNWSDMLRQQDLIKRISPQAASIRFRLPYPESKIQDIKQDQVKYLIGIPFLQPWVGPSSTETRLVIVPNEAGQYPSTTWDLTDYEERMFFHNVEVRDTYRYYNPSGKDHSKEPLYVPELLNSWDDLMEYLILNDYLDRHGVDNRHAKILALSTMLTNSLNRSVKDKVTLDTLRKDPYFFRK